MSKKSHFKLYGSKWAFKQEIDVYITQNEAVVVVIYEILMKALAETFKECVFTEFLYIY